MLYTFKVKAKNKLLFCLSSARLHHNNFHQSDKYIQLITKPSSNNIKVNVHTLPFRRLLKRETAKFRQISLWVNSLFVEFSGKYQFHIKTSGSILYFPFILINNHVKKEYYFVYYLYLSYCSALNWKKGWLFSKDLTKGLNVKRPEWPKHLVTNIVRNISFKGILKDFSTLIFIFFIKYQVL